MFKPFLKFELKIYAYFRTMQKEHYLLCLFAWGGVVWGRVLFLLLEELEEQLHLMSQLFVLMQLHLKGDGVATYRLLIIPCKQLS